MPMGNRRWAIERLPVIAAPPKPLILVLVEHEERFIAELCEFSAPSRSAANSAVVENCADDVDLLAVVHLIPERLQHFANRGTVGVWAIHETRYVLEADVAVLQFLAIEDANAALTFDPVALEREVHLFDAVVFSAAAELGFRARRAATEENALRSSHR